MLPSSYHRLQLDSGFQAHRAAAAWRCSPHAAELAAAATVYSINVCIADTPAAVGGIESLRRLAALHAT
jgi:hypothetical protein